MTILRLPGIPAAAPTAPAEPGDVLAELLNDEVDALLARIQGLRAGACADRDARLDELEATVTRLAAAVAEPGERCRSLRAHGAAPLEREHRALLKQQLGAPIPDPRLLA